MWDKYSKIAYTVCAQKIAFHYHHDMHAFNVVFHTFYNDICFPDFEREREKEGKKGERVIEYSYIKNYRNNNRLCILSWTVDKQIFFLLLTHLSILCMHMWEECAFDYVRENHQTVNHNKQF